MDLRHTPYKLIKKLDGYFNYKLIKKLEDYFINLYNDYNKEYDEVPYGRRTDQVCCTDEERKNIMHYANIITSLPAYSTMRLVDIYIVLIFSYYSLKYNEQSTDWLKIQVLTYFVENLDKNGNIGWLGIWSTKGGNSEDAVRLYYDIAQQDIQYTDSAGVLNNLSSEIRISFLEMAEGRRVRRVRKSRVRTRRVRTRRVRTRRVITSRK